MKLVTYERNGESGLGALTDRGIVDLGSVSGNMMEFLEAGNTAYQKAIECVGSADSWLDEREVRLRAPVPNPRKLLCLARNTSSHIREGGREPLPKERRTPAVFMKPPTTTLIGPGDAIVIPRIGQKIDWECELGVVIGRHARFVSAEEGLDYVAGYLVVNDISERALKIDIDREPQEWDRFFDWLAGKWFDTFMPSGPCLALRDEIPDPQSLGITLRVNGEVKQQGDTGDMIHSVAELVAWISRLVTLEPGDIIATGTVAGVGATTGEFLKPGDIAEGEIEGIGILRNPVEAESGY